jgi:hypothetical protein
MSCASALGVPAKSASLPLREALFAFSDPVLAERWRETKKEALPPPIHLPYPTYDPVLKELVSAERAKLDPAYIKQAEAQNARHHALAEAERKARMAVEQDFRNRVTSGEVVLEGLQFAPSLAPALSVIPSIWGQMLIFSRMDVISVGRKIRFMQVTAFRQVPLVSTAAGSTVSGKTAPAVATARSPRPPGRASYVPLIEADLRANWDEIRRQAANRPGQLPVWSELARAMHKRLARERRNDRRSIPHVQTIRTRLPEIYARLLSEKPVRN